MKKIKGIIASAKEPIPHIFSRYCSDKKNMRLSETDFKKFASVYLPRAKDPEIASLFKHFDVNGKGFITE